jgi:hypothetical protein
MFCEFGTTTRGNRDKKLLRHLLGISKLDNENNQCIRKKWE